MSGRRVVLATAIAIATGVSTAAAQTPPPLPDDLIEKGRVIYEAGRLGSGDPLVGYREGGVTSTGRGAACIACHQRSGFGLYEGSNLVPPITGPSLFANMRQNTRVPRRSQNVEHRNFPFLDRPPYDDASLATALREGLSSGGHRFQFLMPRYALGDADMKALTAYLRQLSAQPSPGASAERLTFATVIAPGQDPVRRRAVIDVLHAYFEEQHAGGHGRQSWQLVVWDLEGAPAGWLSQLRSKLAEQPVFALVSGLGRDEWAPVHQFCELEKVPCLFPNLDAVPQADQSYYSFYFSKGVVLEAQVIARYLMANSSKLGVARVVQLHRKSGPGPRAAAVLRQALAASAIGVEDRIMDGADSGDLRPLVTSLERSDALVLWLDPEDLRALAAGPPPEAATIMLSGLLAGWEHAPLTPAWKRASLMVYQIDAPQRRAARMRFNLQPWLRGKAIAATDEVLLGNTLTACNLLQEGVLRLRGAYFRDYLVEVTERYPSMGNAPAPQAYPKFVLGPGQRFSSAGAYVVRFKPLASDELELVQDWTIPQ